MTTQNENRETVQSHVCEPFPKPQTIPSGWDLSGLPPVPQSASEGSAEADPDARTLNL